MSKKQLPEINAGSMADIAFLLLIFFLVTTTMNVDSGIARKLPPKQEDVPINIKEKNILEVNINSKNEIFVEGATISLKDLKQIAIDFIDNGGGLDKDKLACDWCKGKQLKTSSDHPTKAVISIQANRLTNYETYIAVLDNLNSAYTHLRNKLSVKMYHQNYESLLEEFKKSNNKDKSVEEKIKTIRAKYPLLLSDAEINN